MRCAMATQSSRPQTVSRPAIASSGAEAASAPKENASGGSLALVLKSSSTASSSTATSSMLETLPAWLAWSTQSLNAQQKSKPKRRPIPDCSPRIFVILARIAPVGRDDSIP